ncbi:response regulator transcription factor [Desulfopila aestuarii]|uniref:DNA-binding response regulator, NarL/FixJ family, contains REC and HTH domains n=1 Tax=Desulfopila aestuarii DSM 18488 TaxID=1121416 RepID=A0A1M7Y9B7_9BACT|nr:response regulator transcription factor [Desulfopila aestuarii]SHO49156.1 DNA-binding response regulator, NarL/FixJ family, contains REC and HTH domains [Desulfopila aestuarii DSM 18488]
MAIVCCSQDDKLKEKLVSLFGDKGVLFFADISLVKEDTFQKREVVIVDLPYTTIPEVKNIPLPVIVLTAIPTFEECVGLVQRGVKGYGNRQMRVDNLAQAIGSVKEGQIWLPPAIITQLILTAVGTDRTLHQDDTILSGLSEREQEVARYVAQGMSNQQIADTIFVSLRTVKAHLSSIYEKTGLRNRLELGLRLKGSR